jgi:hypothetical protein
LLLDWTRGRLVSNWSSESNCRLGLRQTIIWRTYTPDLRRWWVRAHLLILLSFEFHQPRKYMHISRGLTVCKRCAIWAFNYLWQHYDDKIHQIKIPCSAFHFIYVPIFPRGREPPFRQLNCGAERAIYKNITLPSSKKHKRAFLSVSFTRAHLSHCVLIHSMMCALSLSLSPACSPPPRLFFYLENARSASNKIAIFVLFYCIFGLVSSLSRRIYLYIVCYESSTQENPCGSKNYAKSWAFSQWINCFMPRGYRKSG